jgi:transglutaminase-like putative cysteine protease
MRTADDLRRVARRAGLSIVGIERVPAAGGGTTLSARMRFRDPWAAARLLKALADEDAADPVVRAWALDILRAAVATTRPSNDGPTLPARAMRAFNRSAHRSVQHAIRFVREPRETFQSARVTMQSGAGDCDDHARLLHALAKSIGGHSRLVFFATQGQPVHVCDELLDPFDSGKGGVWRWAETTVPAAYGEHPRAAFLRLRAAGKLGVR